MEEYRRGSGLICAEGGGLGGGELEVGDGGVGGGRGREGDDGNSDVSMTS